MTRESATPPFTVSRETRERGERLQTARKNAGVGQEQVAKELCDAGLLPSARFQTVSEWETGRAEPALDQLTWMRDRYGFDWGWFFSGSDPKKELAAYRKIAKIVTDTEAATRLPGSPVEEGEDPRDVHRRGHPPATTKEGPS